jgi:toxin ParE1/3/4
LAKQIIWTPWAEDDLDEILSVIVEDSRERAMMVAEKISAAVEKLSEFPEIGHLIPEFPTLNHREVIVYNTG